ncbi:MAG: hypothetical protein CVU74_04070 [Deltaproteobacteria bacterium HGW-Deltaproteobacteria-9]|nr:MAG: hypothetical protein CVU74_04070 [Deltaproteobacteria bacterium HGW-Deltaproteobacteria-9]
MIVTAKSNCYISFGQQLTQQYDMPGRKLRASQKIVLDSIRQTDPEKADALKKHLADAEQVIAQLRSGKSKAAQSRKAEAAEKIKRIKEEIKMLMAMGGDPRMIARQIARLAKDLAAAAREYASAVGASSQYNAVSAETEASASCNNNMSDAAQCDGTAVSTTASLNLSAVTVASGEKGENGKSAPPEAIPEAKPEMAKVKSIQQHLDALRQQMKTDLQSKAVELSSKTSTADANRQFAQEVRTLAALLKLLSRQQKERLHQAGDHSADREIAQTSQALAAAEKSISGVGAPSIIVINMIVKA